MARCRGQLAIEKSKIRAGLIEFRCAFYPFTSGGSAPAASISIAALGGSCTWTRGIARRKVELLAEFDVATTELSDILAAIDLHHLHGFSLWYGMIVLAAKQTGCRVLFSEDLQHAREIDGVAIINPFR